MERTFTLVVPPPNDNFAASAVIFDGDRVQAENSGASKESREPNHAGNPGGKSVWWSFTAPTNGWVDVSTAGSNFDTTLGVYFGPSLWILAEVDSDDDSGPEFTSAVEFFALAGQTYHIAVDGYDGAGGTIELSLDFQVLDLPGNDGFAGRTSIEGDSFRGETDNADAGRETGEPRHGGNAGGASLWWTWTPNAAGTVIIDTSGSTIDTVMGIYTGNRIDGLNTVASDDDSGDGFASRVELSVTANTAYQIAVDGYNGATGDIVLNLDFQSSGPVEPPSDSPADPPLPPETNSNDDFEHAGQLPRAGLTWRTTGSNLGATREPAEPAHADRPGGASVWWQWTAPTTGQATVSTAGSDFDTILGIYRSFGGGMNGLLVVASNDDHNGLTSHTTFRAEHDVTYWIAVDGYGGTAGTIALELGLNSAALADNDTFQQRTLLAGSDLNVSGDNTFASREAGEPWHLGHSSGASVWWTWTAPKSGRVVLSTQGSEFDTTLAVYGGTTLGNLQEIASNDDSANPAAALTSEVIFEAVGGSSYQIAVDGYGGATGVIKLNLSQTPPSGRRTRLTNFSVRATGGSADQALILGFTSRGALHREVLMRAVGPSLRDFGVANALANPAIELFTESFGQNLSLNRNDDWSDAPTLTAAFSRVGAFPLAAGSRDAALTHRVSPSAHTLVVSGHDEAGVVLNEVYELSSPGADTEFSNISVRNFVGTGDDVLILGFVLDGDTEREVLIRGVGPALEEFGVQHVLANPRLRVLDAHHNVIASNDDWHRAAPALRTVFGAVGAFDLPQNSGDSATTMRLGPGVYSVIVDDEAARSGNALVEIYLLP